jgi:hypothetical protein
MTYFVCITGHEISDSPTGYFWGDGRVKFDLLLSDRTSEFFRIRTSKIHGRAVGQVYSASDIHISFLDMMFFNLLVNFFLLRVWTRQTQPYLFTLCRKKNCPHERIRQTFQKRVLYIKLHWIMNGSRTQLP